MHNPNARVSIHLEIPGSRPKGGIPQLACRNPFKANEITHTQDVNDVTCGKCKRFILNDPRLRKRIDQKQRRELTAREYIER